MKLPPVVRQLFPASAASNMARDPQRAIRGFNQVLSSVHNLPRSLDNKAYRAETRLMDFVRQAQGKTPDKQEFKAALDNLRHITADIASRQRVACLDKGKDRSANSEDYIKLIQAHKQGIAMKHFKAK